MPYTIEDQVNNYFNDNGYNFDTYLKVMEDLNTLSEAAFKCHGFSDLYRECVDQASYLERIVKEKFTADGEKIKDE